MKVILAGSTGSIGSVVLQQCLDNPAISSIVVLSRRALPSHISSPKLKVLILEDFLTYPPSVLQKLKGAQACIWVLGGIPSRFPDLATARKVNIDFPLAGSQAFISALTPLPKRQKFNFVYCSGRAARRDLEKKYWFFNDARKIKGEIENKLIEIEEQNSKVFKAYLPKPGSVVPPNRLMISFLVWLTTWFYPAMGTEVLAAAMIDVALNGCAEQALSHEDLVAIGEALLREKK